VSGVASVSVSGASVPRGRDVMGMDDVCGDCVLSRSSRAFPWVENHQTLVSAADPMTWSLRGMRGKQGEG